MLSFFSRCELTRFCQSACARGKVIYMYKEVLRFGNFIGKLCLVNICVCMKEEDKSDTFENRRKECAHLDGQCWPRQTTV